MAGVVSSRFFKRLRLLNGNTLKFVDLVLNSHPTPPLVCFSLQVERSSIFIEFLCNLYTKILELPQQHASSRFIATAVAFQRSV
jgi:hypothetical protein